MIQGANVRTNVVAANDDIIESADTPQPQKASVPNPGPSIRHVEKPPKSGTPSPQNVVAVDIHDIHSFPSDIHTTGDAQSTVVVGVDVHPVGAVDMQKAVTMKPPNGSSNGAQNVQTRQPVIATSAATVVQGNVVTKATTNMEAVIPGLALGTTTGSMR